jgi:pyruvate-formate lyase-activating enzyme
VGRRSFQEGAARGFRTAFISNGNATPQVLDYLRPWTDCYKIDLKSMSDKNYRQLGGVVDNILDTVKMVHERGFWEEIVTLVIPGFNDSTDELQRAADFIASVSPDIPWHVTAVSSGLPHAGKREYDGGTVDSRVRDRTRGRSPLHLCRKSSGSGGPLGEHILSEL